MESELLINSIRSSLINFANVGIILNIVYFLLRILNPYFLRNLSNIKLKYTQNLYLTAYELIKNIILYSFFAIYICIIIFIISNNSEILNINFIYFILGSIILIMYIVANLFIDFYKNIIFLSISLFINLISLLLVFLGYYQLLANNI